ncbi:DNA repair protein RadA [Candidatus Dependentiae bacterium]|nr:DNA repair protein RadA [Candidatus Dependentiae bacterium]
MAKEKKTYCCSNCGCKTSKWVGCCPTCGEWNSFIEERITTEVKESGCRSGEPVKLFSIDAIQTEQHERMCSGVQEWDRVLGGGILPGSFLILTGDPGIGKSTLLLQIANALAQAGRKVLYFSSEESLQQVKNRACRLGVTSHNILFSDQANLEGIVATGKAEKPDLVIIDSIQNCLLSEDSSTIPGTIGQLRESGFYLMRFAKENTIATVVTGHITKDGHIAGPKVLEHMVDGLFYLQGEDRWHTRILRSVKNRFGTINEIGFFEMREHGLQEVANINQYLISDISSAPGSVLVCTVEGSRPLLLELQALCVASKFGVPQRIVTGLDHKRVSLIAAILEKNLHVKLSSQDIFFKVSGGFSIKESSVDLGIALALLSSYFQVPVPEKSVAIGEINLAGHVKPANYVDLRVREAEKFGITKVLGSRRQKMQTACETILFKNIYELLKLFPE